MNYTFLSIGVALAIITITEGKYLLASVAKSEVGDQFRNDAGLDLSNIKSELKSLSDRLEKKETEQIILEDKISKLERIGSRSNMESPLLIPGFIAVRNSSNYTTDGFISNGTIKEYDEVKGKGLDKDTGVFFAPVSGTYIFFFNAYISSNSQRGEIYVIKNGKYMERQFYSNVPNIEKPLTAARQLSTSWTMDLKASDTVHLSNIYNSTIYISSFQTLTFMGFLVKF